MKRLYQTGVYLKMCIRNIFRNRRRTTITLASIVIGTMSLILVTGYINVMEKGIQSQAIASEFGHIQIGKSGYFDRDQSAYDFMMEEHEFSAVEDFLLTVPEVDLVNKRLHIAGIIGDRSHSTVFLGICGQSDIEIFMSPNIVQGMHFGLGGSDSVVIGEAMAEKLSATIDQTFLLLFSSPSGAQEALTVTVSGIYHGMLAEQESVLIYMPLETAWELMLERKVHRIIVLLRDGKDIPLVIERLGAFIDESNLDLEVRSWRELAVFYEQIITMFRRIVLVVGVVILVVIVFGISNTMHMVIFDRTREIGTMRAIGDSRTQIMMQLVIEGTLMGLIGASLAVVLSIIFVPVINRLGITLPPGPGQDEPIPLFIQIDFLPVLLISVGATVVAGFSTILPSLRAVRLGIAHALRSL